MYVWFMSSGVCHGRRYGDSFAHLTLPRSEIRKRSLLHCIVMTQMKLRKDATFHQGRHLPHVLKTKSII